MKKHIVWILVLIVLLMLFVPIPLRYNDGGSIAYKAALYTVYDVHRLNDAGEQPYIEGIIIKILGREVYNSTNPRIEF